MRCGKQNSKVSDPSIVVCSIVIVFVLICNTIFGANEVGTSFLKLPQVKIAGQLSQFKPGTEIMVNWRAVPVKARYRATKPYKKLGTIKAVDAPFEGGGITERQLFKLIRSRISEGKIVGVWACYVEPGSDPARYFIPEPLTQIIKLLIISVVPLQKDNPGFL